MTIKLFSPLLPGQELGDPIEYEGNLLDLMRAQENGFTLEEKRADFQVIINGRPVPFSLWDQTGVDRDDDVRIVIAPKGGIFSAIGSIVGGLFKVVFGLFGMRSSAGAGYRGTGQGAQLEAASLRSNTPRMGATVPEQFGRYRRFCDSLNEQRRFFVDKREQFVDALLHVTIGEVDSPEVFLGTTPLDELPDSEYWIHQPNEVLTGHEPAQLWHNSPAVGGTSGGTAGIMLSADVETAHNVDPSGGYTFDNLTITRDSGAFPESWGQGTIVKVSYPRTYTTEAVWDSNTETYSTQYTGFFGHVPLSEVKFQDSFIDYEAVLVSDNGGGFLTIVFKRVEGSQLYWDGSIQPGSVVRSYGDEVEREILTISPTEIVLDDDGLFFESAVVPSSTVTFVRLLYGPWSPRFVVSPTGQNNTEVEVDFFFPRGLLYTQDDGSAGNNSVTIDIEFSDENGVVPTVILRRVYSDATPDQIGFTEKFTYASPAKCRVRARRIGAVSADPRRIDEVHWYGLRCRMPDKSSYPWTTLSVRLKSGNQLGSQSENQINVVSTRILPEMREDGTLTAPTPTRDIAAALVRIGKGASYTLADWHPDIAWLNWNFWRPRGENFDFVLDEKTVKASLDSVLAAGFSELTIEDGYLKPVRDMPRLQLEQGFSPQNIIGEVTETARHHRSDDNDGYEIEYTDADTWEQMTIVCKPPGSLGLRLKKEKLDGVVDRTIAWRIGMRRAMSDVYRRRGFGWRTSAAGLNAYYMGYVAVMNSLRDWGQSFLALSVERSGGSALIILSEPVVVDGIAPPYIAAMVNKYGNVVGPFSATLIGDSAIEITGVSVDLPTPSLDRELPQVFFGQVNKMINEVLIQNVQPDQGMYAKIDAINYDERVYQFDDESPAE